MKLQLAGWLLGAAPPSAAWGAPEPENPFGLAGKAARVGLAASVNYPRPLPELRRQRPAFLRSTQAGTYWPALAAYAAGAGELDSAAAYWQLPPGAYLVPPAGPTALTRYLYVLNRLQIAEAGNGFGNAPADHFTHLALPTDRLHPSQVLLV
jgi:hypothetical protein